MTARSLADLPAKSFGMVSSFNMPEEESIRVRTLGVCPGMSVEVVQNGDPLILSTAGTRIGIARRLACQVLIDVELPAVTVAP